MSFPFYQTKLRKMFMTLLGRKAILLQSPTLNHCSYLFTDGGKVFNLPFMLFTRSNKVFPIFVTMVLTTCITICTAAEQTSKKFRLKLANSQQENGPNYTTACSFVPMWHIHRLYIQTHIHKLLIWYRQKAQTCVCRQFGLTTK